MTTTSTKPTRPRLEQIAGHAYTVPVVRELPMSSPRDLSDATW